MENNRKNSQADTEKYNLEFLLRRPSLRASISRRVSQVRRETISTPDTICGLWCIRGQWLQSFANRTTFVFVYEVLGSFYASYIAYFYGSITTLEKAFKFSNQNIGLLAASGDILKILVCLVLSAFPPKVHKPRCLGVAVFFIILSAIIFSTPHFFYSAECQINGHITECKDGNCIESFRTSKETNKNKAFYVFLSTQILHGIGGGMYLTQGKSYKDNNIHLHQSHALTSLLSTLKTIGPAFGYWLSSVCLKSHVTLEKVNDGHKTHWIGAWWLGNLMIAFILFVGGFLLILFPSTLPKAAVRKIFSNTRTTTDVKQNLSDKGIPKLIKTVYINPAFNITLSLGTFNGWGFLAYFIFLPKYVEIQYRIPASTANLTAGSITLISAALGIVTASSVIARFRPNARAITSWNIIVGILSVSTLTSYTYLGCTENDTQIKTIASQYSSLGKSCDCEFHPICVKSETILLCHFEYDELFHNDTKVIKNYNHTLNDNNNKELIKDLCPVDCYSKFLLFILVTCFLVFTCATGQTSNFWFEIKCAKNINKFHPMKLHLFNILVLLPGPIIFGYVLDRNCLVWDNNCTGTGNCWLYDNENLRYGMNITAISFAIIGIILNMVIWYSVKNITLFHHDDEMDENYT